MPMRQKRRIAIVILASVLAVAIVPASIAWRYGSTIAFLLDASNTPTGLGALIPATDAVVAVEALSIPTRTGPLDARLYLPSPESRRTVVVFPGVHAGGIDEPRLERFARRLAATGVNVLNVPLPDLRVFRIVGRSTDEIEDATLWAAKSPRLAPDGHVGLAGVSFAGGLAMVAAGRPSLVGRLDLVFSLGGHGDLGRVLRYLGTGRLPDGTKRPPHDYGVAIAALTAAPRLVPADQVARLEQAIRLYLEASVDESAEQAKATALLNEARRLGAAMPEPGRSIMTWVNDHDVVALGAAIVPHIEALASDSRLSPERSPLPSAPVFLLQGDADNVIPSSETPQLAESLRARGHSSVHALLTPLLSHMSFNPRAGLLDRWRLVLFWQAMRDGLQ